MNDKNNKNQPSIHEQIDEKQLQSLFHFDLNEVKEHCTTDQCFMKLLVNL